MPTDNRETLLSRIDAKKGILALELDQIESMDTYLKSQWGISRPPSSDLSEEQLLADVPASLRHD